MFPKNTLYYSVFFIDVSTMYFGDIDVYSGND